MRQGVTRTTKGSIFHVVNFLNGVEASIDSSAFWSPASKSAEIVVMFGLHHFTPDVLCCAYSLSHVWVFATPRTAAHQAPLSMVILQARMLEWLGWDLPNPGIEPSSPALQADSLPTEQPGKPLPQICSVWISECGTGNFLKNPADESHVHYDWKQLTVCSIIESIIPVKSIIMY